jgi:type II secretory ATPase GspE/PulE/Tfp pilus assembly ATPase PilB-like protein
MPGVNQVNVTRSLPPRCAYFYVKTPDIIMVGEIRDLKRLTSR